MNYYQNLNQKKIPTPLALLALVLILFVVPFAFQKPGPTKSNAKDIVQTDLSISNLTNQSVTINWTTPIKQTSWILYGLDPNKMTLVGIDERDFADKKTPYSHHYVTLNGLEAHKVYYYKIVTDKGIILDSNKPFSFTTASQVGLTNNNGPSFGKVINTNGAPAKAIVFLNIDGAISLSSLTKETTGEFLIPTYFLLRNPQDGYNPKPESLVIFKIVSENGDTSTVKTLFSKIGPLDQTIILGKDYDFTGNEQVLSETIKSTEQLKKIDIIFPADNAVIPGNRPLYKGVAVPGSKIVVTFEPNTYTLQTVTDKDGVWKISSNKALESGPYMMSLNTTDEKNKPVSVKRSFTIAKSGEAVLGEATGSATLTPTIVVAQRVTPTPASAATTITPQPTYQTTTITPSPTLPSTGVSYMAFTMISVALIVIGAGIILIF